MSASAPRVLFVYADHVGASMGGVGIRALELARALRETCGADVAIAAAETDGADLGVPVTTFAPHAPHALAAPLAAADVVCAQPLWPLAMRRLARAGARLVFDLYDPEAFGTLNHFEHRPRRRSLMGSFTVDRLNGALRVADHVMCASERQRDLWIGAMLATGSISARDYDRDPSLRRRIDVVPYGVPLQPPRAVGVPVRERLGLTPDDEVVLWNGGVWSWFDAPTAIRAIAVLRERRPRARLVFMGMSDAAPAVRATREARELAAALGQLDTGVLFAEGWVPYAERADWLLAADCAISTHADHLESRYSSRTRVLDCFWAGLPVVCTDGDELAARVEREGLGEVVAPGDHRAAAAAVERVLDRGRDAYDGQLAAAAEAHAWHRVIEPLVRWLEGPSGQPERSARLLRRPSAELLRSGAYVAAAGALAAVGRRPPNAG